MKRIKRKIEKFLVVVSLFLTVFAIMSIANTEKVVSTMAQESSENVIDTSDSETPKNLIISIENELQEQGKSIVDVLEDQKEFYERELTSVDAENQSVISSKLESVMNAMNDVPLYMETLSNNDSGEEEPSARIVPFAFHLSPNCTCGIFQYSTGIPCVNCIEYLDVYIAVVAVATGFQARGWLLAADLLWFNLSNTTLDIDYYPTLGSQIAQAPQIANELAYIDQMASSFDQQTPGRLNGLFESTIEGDVYNSFGSFYYSKTLSSEGMVNILIQDRYDWDPKNNGGSASILNNTMLTAQELGILTPFYTRINLTIPGYASFDWEYDQEGVIINSGANGVTNVNIPAQISDIRARLENLPEVNVVAIKENAFADQTQITSVTLPNTIANIGESAFKGCTRLTSINLPTSVTEIGASAFAGCTSLQNITLPFIGEKADGTGETHFGYVFGAESKAGQNEYLPQNLTVRIDGASTIPAEAFYGIDRIEKLILSSTVTEIENGAFSYHTNLSQLEVEAGNPVFWASGKCLMQGTTVAYGWKGCVIPQTATKIGDFAFQNRTDLTGVVLPESVAEIGEEAFRNSGLLQIDLPSGLTAMGEKAFYGCSSLSAVTVSAGCSLEVIPLAAFAYCSSLTDVTIPETVEEIGDYAFCCSSVTDIVFSANVERIGERAFYDCSSLESVAFEDESNLTEIDEWAFLFCENLKTVDFGENSALQTIGEEAFGYTAIRSLVLPSGVCYLPTNVFLGCSSLAILYTENTGYITLEEGVTSGVYVKYLIVPSLETATLYQGSNWEDVLNVHCIETDYLFVTGLTFDESMEFFPIAKEFSGFYLGENLDANWLVSELEDGDYSGVVFFVTSEETLPTIYEFLGYEMEIPYVILSLIGEVEELPVFIKDTYSAGLAIGREYRSVLTGLEAWETSYCDELEAEVVSRIVVSQSLQQNVSFLAGLSQGLGAIADVTTMNEAGMTETAFFNDDYWLFIDVETVPFSSSSYHETKNFFAFLWSDYAVEDWKEVSDRVYRVGDKIDYIAELNYAYSQGTEIEICVYEELNYNPAVEWQTVRDELGEEEYARLRGVLLNYVSADEMNVTAFTEYAELCWARAGFAPESGEYSGVSGFDECWENCKICYLEQQVIAV